MVRFEVGTVVDEEQEARRHSIASLRSRVNIFPHADANWYNTLTTEF